MTWPRPGRLEIQCAGMAGECLGSEVMGFPITVLGLAEPKPAAQKFLQANWSHMCSHMHKKNSALIGTDGGECFTRGARRCRRSGTRLERPDISTSGSPCQPFSPARATNGTTNKTQGAAEHPLYPISMDDFEVYIAMRLPHMLIIEEVEGFLKPLSALMGRSPFSVLKGKVARFEYGIEALTLNHEIFIDVARPRVWIIGVHTDSGGLESARFIVNMILDVVRELLSMQALQPASRATVSGILHAEKEHRRTPQVAPKVFVCCVSCPW